MDITIEFDNPHLEILLRDDLYIYTSLKHWEEWKDKVNRILSDYHLPEWGTICADAIRILEKNRQIFLDNPPNEIHFSWGSINGVHTRPEEVQKGIERFLKGYKKRIDFFSQKAQEATEQAKGAKSGRASTPQQVLAMHYLFEYLQVRNVDQTQKARFIAFLTGKNTKNIYDAIRNPLSTRNQEFRKRDLQAIRPLFEGLGLTEIVKMINNELEKADL